MLYALSTRHNKKIAGFFLMLFYAEIVIAGAKRTYAPTKNAYELRTGVNSPVPPAIRPSLPVTTKKLPALQKKGKAHMSALPQTVVPNSASPGQPEMQTFKSIGTDNMVDLFTGDFSYNIPLLDVGGYPINIFYNSGVTMDQEAAWTGLGWNINPGTISRNMRGLPDDFNGEEKITKTQHVKDDITVGADVGGSAELAGFPQGSFNMSTGIFYNSYKGFGLEAGFGLSASTRANDDKTTGVSPMASLNFRINSQQGATITPTLGVNIFDADQSTKSGFTASVGYNSRTGIQNLQLSGEMTRYGQVGKLAEFLDGSITFAKASYTPSIRMPLTRSTYNLGVTPGLEGFPGFAGANIKGYYIKAGISTADITQKKPAYGYLYMDKGQADGDALMDFNRVNDGVYTPNTPVISMPNYTYDVYSMSGEGTGGTFRPYRGDVGYVKDNYTQTRDNSYSLDAEFGWGESFELGANVHAILSPTKVGEWKNGNLAANALKFHRNDSIYQAVYFRNPAEKTIGNNAFTSAVGDNDLVRLRLANLNLPEPNTVPVLERFGDNRLPTGQSALTPLNTIKQLRDKRSQVISYLDADEASEIGLDRDILSYPLNQFPLGGCSPASVSHIPRTGDGRLGHHISQINVLNGDGRRYVYGIPAYNTDQEEVSFATNNSGNPNGDQTVIYNEDENSATKNKAGHDNYYQKEAVPAYAHTFLLTGLLSPDYVDLKGDGITDDDLGDAVRFNYTRISNGSGNVFNWRAPFTKDPMVASFADNLKTDNYDNKASYTYGQRELWYTNSIESKNMVATFTVSERRDAREARGADGGIGTNGMKKLDRIDLYTKADRIKLGNGAKPIKTVHFSYSYTLCNGVPSNADGSGKLTLDSIWFSYNGNEKQVRNKYVFRYSNNPSYSRPANDRWGSYKPSVDPTTGLQVNPGGMNNADYPYSVQDKGLADRYAGAWVLSGVQLPSGGKIGVTYESDDYAYVQDRRAAQMFGIAGFGRDKTSTPSNNLYIPGKTKNDYYYVFVDTRNTGNTVATADRYFEGVRQLYIKEFVGMPSDVNGSGYEAVPVYAEITEYGVSPNNNRLLYAKVRPIQVNGNDASPMASAAIEFLRDYLPSKAFLGSDVSKASGLKAALLALNALVPGITGTFKDFENTTARGHNLCNTIDLSRSFIRLNNPGFNKLGGGLRVKRVEISDNFAKMTQKTDAAGNVTDPGMHTSVYGQEYDYTTTAIVGGTTTTISSGVATYEPGIGAEENPFREMLHYSDTQPMGPTQVGSIEVPIGEMFYPSPMVGYSRVTVRSINRDTVKSGVGTQVTEFYTSKDFPVLSDFTDLDPASSPRYKSNPILELLHLDTRQTVTISQGFRVQINDMNGKIKTQASYGEDTTKLISYTANYYRMQKKTDGTYALDNKVLATTGPDGGVKETQVGKDVELMTDFREHNTETITANIDINTNGAFYGFPIVLFTTVPPVYYSQSLYRSASVVKIINTYGILDSVVSIDKGSQVSTKDIVFDGETGNALLTRTNNEFNDPVYNFSYPAHWAYSGMHPAYRNIDLQYKGVVFRHGRIENSPQVNTARFESGDELYVESEGQQTLLSETQPCSLVAGAGQCDPLQYTITPSYTNHIWALDVTKDRHNGIKQFIFIDSAGNPFNGDNIGLRVVRSGKRNLLNQSVGSVTSQKSPLQYTNGVPTAIIPTDNNGILNTAAATFKDNWRVDNAFYVKDSLVQNIVKARIKKKSYLLSDRLNVTYAKTNDNNPQLSWSSTDSYLYLFNKYQNKTVIRPSIRWTSNSYLLFDFSQDPLPVNAVASQGFLSLYSHTNDIYASPSADHPIPDDSYVGHNNVVSQHTNIIGRINYLTSGWIGSVVNYANVNQYFSPATAPLSSTMSPIQAAMNGNDSYYYNSGNPSSERRIDISDVLKGNSGSVLYNQGKIGLQLSMPQDDDTHMRCFWANIPNGKLQIKPQLDYYYYVCGDTSLSYATDGDPYVDNMVTCQTSYAYSSFCLSTFDKKKMNPYVQGVLGNWRTERAYTYYGDRRGPSIGNGTPDLRTAGAINNFLPFWALDKDSLRTPSSVAQSKVWVWNSEVTQFNKRGFEVENHDPLGRYNSGIYGYSQALPVAVANNAKYREIGYDGFEDYGYASTPCAESCQPHRHMNIANAQSMLADTVAHTGKYSLRVAGGSEAIIKAPVVDSATDMKPYSVRIRMDSARIDLATVSGKGRGWQRDEYDHVIDQPMYLPKTTPGIIDKFINFGYTDFGSVTKIWYGIFQPQKSGTYTFDVNTDDGSRLFISTGSFNGTSIQNDLLGNSYWGTHGLGGDKKVPYNMTAGTLYYIELQYINTEDNGAAYLLVKGPCDADFGNIPTSQVYSPVPVGQSVDTTGTTFTQVLWCVKPDTIQVRGNALTDSLSLIRGRQMVVGAWVKEGSTDCKCSGYTNNAIQVAFPGSSQTLVPMMQPTGNIIEGWQRYEGTFTVPMDATSVEVHLKNTATDSRQVFFDDVRIHPYNGNMKSFAYHPSNLRLMAELDENNYASFYEYDDDGTLVRVKKETIKGITTISETRSSLQKAIQ